MLRQIPREKKAESIVKEIKDSFEYSIANLDPESNSVRKTILNLFMEYGRAPTRRELAKRTEMPLETVDVILRKLMPGTSWSWTRRVRYSLVPILELSEDSPS